MRCILIDNVRQKRRLKHGDDRMRVDLLDGDLATDGPSDELVALDGALTELAQTDATKAELVKLRCFASLTIDAKGPESKRPTKKRERAVTSTVWLSAGSRAPGVESTVATSGPGPSS